MRPYVACYWTLRTSSAGPHRVLPDGCMDLIFDLRRARSTVIGAMTQAVVERSDAFDALGRSGCRGGDAAPGCVLRQ